MAAATNDLNKVIKSNAQHMHIFTDTIKSVVQSCSTIDKKSVDHVKIILDSFKPVLDSIRTLSDILVANPNFQKNIKTLKNIMSSIIEMCNYIVNYQRLNISTLFTGISNYTTIIANLIDAVKLITNLKTPQILPLRLKLFFLRFVFKNIYKSIHKIIEILNLTKDSLIGFVNAILFTHIMNFFEKLQNIIDLISSINIKFMLTASFKLWFLKRFIKKLIKTISYLGTNLKLSGIVSLGLTTSILQFIFTEFDHLLTTLKNFLTFKTTFWIWWNGKKYIRRLKRVIKYINKISHILNKLGTLNINNAAKLTVNMFKMNIVLFGLQSFVNVIRYFKAPFFFKWKVIKLIGVIRNLRMLVSAIIKFIRQIDKGLGGLKLMSAIQKLRKLKKLFKVLTQIVQTIIASAVLFTLAIPAFVIVLLGVATLRLIVNGIILLIRSIRWVGIKIFLKLTLFITLLTFLMTIGAILIVFGLMLPFVIKSLISFGIFLLCLIGVISMIIVFGALMTLLAPLVTIIMIGLILTGTLILMIGVLMVTLKIIEYINLDTDKIKNNIRTILDVAKMLIDSIFGQDEEQKQDDKSKPWYKSVLEWLGGNIGTIIQAILSIAFLALTFVSIALITLIAIELRLLQELNLNKTLIKQNVDIVLETARSVIESIFDAKDDKEDDPSSKSFFRTLIDFLGVDKLVKIIDAVMSIAFLALTLVSITLISFIASQLKSLQELNLNQTLIKQNVDIVLETAKMIVNNIFKKDDTQTHPVEGGENGIFGKLLKMALPSRMGDFLNAIASIGFLCVVNIAIGLIKNIAENLTSIIQLPSMDGITDKVQLITSTANSLIKSVFNDDKSSLRKMRKQAEHVEEYLNSIINIPGLVAQILTDLNKISSFDDQMYLKASTMMNNVIKNLMETLSIPKINIDRSKAQMLTTVVRHMTDMMSLPGEKFDNLNTSLKNYNDFLTKINDVDLTKLKTTVKLFEQMVNFSKSINGNFEDLADSLNEKIAPLLEELKESLTAVQQHVSEKPSTDMEAEKRSIFSNFKQNGQTQNLTQSQIETKVEDKYKDNIQQRYGIDEILSKISTLTDLFQNGDARVKTT